MNCPAAKQRLRETMIERRALLTPDECNTASNGFRISLPALLAELGLAGRPLRLGVYSAIRNEADLSLACHDLLLGPHPVELYYPAVQGRGELARLAFGMLPPGVAPENFLVCGKFGVCEPPPSSWLAELPHLDLVLMPGLAFDRHGNRLGWGRAFYDRLIPQLPGRPVLAGVCYDFQIVPEGVPCDTGDLPVDWLLTPHGYLPTS